MLSAGCLSAGQLQLPCVAAPRLLLLDKANAAFPGECIPTSRPAWPSLLRSRDYTHEERQMGRHRSVLNFVSGQGCSAAEDGASSHLHLLAPPMRACLCPLVCPMPPPPLTRPPAQPTSVHCRRRSRGHSVALPPSAYLVLAPWNSCPQMAATAAGRRGLQWQTDARRRRPARRGRATAFRNSQSPLPRIPLSTATNWFQEKQN